MKVRMKVKGGDKIARRLQMLAEETARKYIRESALEGAEVIRQAAVDKAPKQTGTLKDNIYKEIEKQTKSKVDVRVGPGGDGWYGRLVEEGHRIVKGGKRVVKGDGRVRYYGGKEVGRVKPYPFLRPAFDEKTDEAQKKMIEVLRRRLGL